MMHMTKVTRLQPINLILIYSRNNIKPDLVDAKVNLTQQMVQAGLRASWFDDDHPPHSGLDKIIAIFITEHLDRLISRTMAGSHFFYP